MRNIEIDCRNINSPKALQIYIQYRLDFPEWYGRNLDALYDMLTTNAYPVCLTIVTGPEMNEEMKTYISRLMRVIQDAARENETLTYKLIEK
jgi:ribonuclease inhibitor